MSLEKQLIISAFLGDGHIRQGGYVTYSSSQKEYMAFKKKLSPNMSEISESINLGFKKDGKIFKVHLKTSEYAKNFSIENISEIDDLGLALWFYDDISLHQTKHFYNINSHSFTEEEHDKYLIPLLNRFKIYPTKVRTKKDGKYFTYLCVQKYKGGLVIDSILRKHLVECYRYKLLPDYQIENLNTLKDKYRGFAIQSTTLSKLITLNKEVFLAKLDKLILNSGFITMSKSRKPLIKNNDTIIL